MATIQQIKIDSTIYDLKATYDSEGNNITSTYATKTELEDSIADLVDSAPGTLDTLNELAAALGDDKNFSTTVTNLIATKLPLAGGNMTGHIYLTGVGSTSTSNTSQLVFGTAASNHIALSSNNNALIINPTTSSTTNQIVLYLDQASVFPNGISGNASSATKLATARTISLTGSVTGSGSFDGSGNLSIATTTNHTHNYAGSSSAGGAATNSDKIDGFHVVSTSLSNYNSITKDSSTIYLITS